ncbi:hypothetical protein XENOCAPTIV_027743 [Xenoophorus captivus]|uniref:Uncharacterized protein n=1 Tax=Xenoophorus captivus TaxID=1517983 RepID=A0ABV0R561_9TELE
MRVRGSGWAGTEFENTPTGEREGEGVVEVGEECDDRGLLGLCPALPNTPPTPPTVCPSSFGLSGPDQSSSIFSNGVVKLCIPDAIIPDEFPSELPCPNVTSSTIKVILDPDCAVPVPAPDAIWPWQCQSLCWGAAGLEGDSGEEAMTAGMLALERVPGGLCCCC